VCNFSYIEVEEDDIDVIEEVFKTVHEEVGVGIKQEEIPGDVTFPDIKSEPGEVSYVCICLLLDTFYQCPGVSVFLLCHYFWPIETAPLLGIKLFCCCCPPPPPWCVVGWVCTGWVGQHVIAKRRNVFLYPCWKESISTGCFLKAVPIPSACTVEFL
jgi:hypothetical protein